MSAEFDSPEPEAVSRAHWLRSEGMVIFDELFRRSMTHILDNQTEEKLIGFGYGGYTPTPTTAYEQQQEAEDIAFNTVSSLFSEFSLQQNPELLSIPPAYAQAISKSGNNELEAHPFLFQGVDRALRESLNTGTNFPLGLLSIANMRYMSEGNPPLYTSVKDIARIMRRDWFKENCEIAAFTANGVWSELSTDRPRLETNRVYELGQFLFSTIDDEVRFAFSARTHKTLVDALRRRNRDYQLQLRANAFMADTSAQGSTTGCPVRRLAPEFYDTTEDQSRLQQLASLFDKSAAELAAPREQTTIAWGIDQMAGLLERIHTYKLQADDEPA